MISFEDFRGIFTGAGFSEKELRRFYGSVRKSVILKHVGRRAWPQLIKLEEMCQWPVLRKIDDPSLSIYQGADDELRDEFIKNIGEEKELRKKKGPHKVPSWTRLQRIVSARIDLLTHIFNFSGEDSAYCESVSKRYGAIIERRSANKKKLWKIGLGAGAATLAGAAAFWYLSHEKK
jgi:hypothetical protein